MNYGDYLKPPSIWERLIRLIYPIQCMVCGNILKEDTSLYICETCHRTLPRYEKGFHRKPELTFIDGILAAYYYDEGIDTAIHALKYRDQPRIARTMSYLIYEQMAEEKCLPDFDIIIPVPMHIRKKRRRGYNQSELIGRELSPLLNVPNCTDILIKTKNTPPQNRLKREERLHNMTDVFALQEGRDVSGKNILIIDDVSTTGTTLNSCAKILYEHGASYIFAAVIAIADR